MPVFPPFLLLGPCTHTSIKGENAIKKDDRQFKYEIPIPGKKERKARALLVKARQSDCSECQTCRARRLSAVTKEVCKRGILEKGAILLARVFSFARGVT